MFFRDGNAPFATRADTMSLDVIRPDDVPRGKVRFIKPESMSLKTDDIHKSTPYFPHKDYLNRPNKGEIPGTRANTLYPETNRVVDNALRTQDIEWAQPKVTQFNTNRCIDPLQPHYMLSQVQTKPATPPRWNGRNTLDVSDIDHACSRVVIPTRNYMNDPNDIADIEYASPNYHRRAVRPVDEGAMSRSLDVRDILQGSRVAAPRGTNPLDPQYLIPQSSTTSLAHMWTEEAGCVEPVPTEPQVIGEVAMSKPRKLQWDNGEPQFSLLKEDIAGANSQRFVGSIPMNIYDPPDKKAVISFHEPQDIPGAQVGSLKKGIVTNRAMHPLQPDYVLLDGTVNNSTQRAAGFQGSSPYRKQAMDTERGSTLRGSAYGVLSNGSTPMSRASSQAMLTKDANAIRRDSSRASVAIQ
mmetsp:Transcript_49938/g.109077  ORF Transcript_49938/g.109077 Transcript_49938/m.109077 type:complete len:411 (-) Transcript_49938:120-1352(-)